MWPLRKTPYASPEARRAIEEDRRRNAAAIAVEHARAAWERRLRLLVADLRDRAEILRIDEHYSDGLRQAAIDLEEAVDLLAKKEGSNAK